MEEILERVYFSNTLEDYLIALGIILGGIVLLRLFKKVILKRLKKWSTKTNTSLDDYMVSGAERFGIPILNCLAIYIGFTYLNLTERAERIIQVSISVVATYFILRLVSSVIQLLLKSYIQRQERGEEKIRQINGIMLIINILIWVLGILFLFDNLGYDVTTIIAGLGIGGIAIALAAQNILGDLFNYMVIIFDRPFELDDFIVMDDKKGTVDYIGIKTTRLKSLTGEQLILSNSDLTKSRIHNFKRMDRRRIEFTIGVTYDTSLENLKAIPIIIKNIITNLPDTTFDRAHFLSYGDFSLNYQVVYFIETADFNRYADLHQELNLAIFQAFQEREIEFAFPTQTVHIPKKDRMEGVKPPLP